MSPLAGPFFAAALLLAVAGVGKVVAPDRTRVALRTAGLPASGLVARGLGIGEVALAAAAIVVGGVVPALGIAAAYLGFAGFAALLARRSRGAAPCGCFGSGDAPVGRLHVVVNVLVAAAAVTAATEPVDGFVAVARDTPAAGVPFAAFTLLLTWLLLVALTALPELLAAGRPTPGTAGGAR